MYQRDEERVKSYRNKLSSIEQEISALKKQFLFDEVFRNVRDIEKKLDSMDRELNTIRQKGFIFGRNWEQMITDYKQDLPNIKGKADFRTNIDSKEVDDILDAVLSGGISSTMIPESREKEKEEKPLPKIDRCPACGASLTKPIVKGMTHIKCEYCGKVIYF